MSALERTWRFDREIRERAAQRVRPFGLGTAIYADDLPRVYDTNLLWIDGPLDGIGADDVERLADSLQGELGHRKVVVPGGAEAERLARDLTAHRWSASRTLVMEYAGPAERDPGRSAGAELVDPRAVRAARLESTPNRSSDVQRQVADFGERLGAVAGGRVFATFADGEVAAFCILLEGGGIAEIHEVTTLDRFRRRGLAGAAVEAAIAASLSDGHDLLYILAVEDDWPKDWYGRLGFREIGYRYELYKT